MSQRLSAMNYIKNNKRRVSVLAVSLTLCFALFYLSQFLLSVSTETFGSLLLDSSEKIQYISLPESAFGLRHEDYEGLEESEYLKQYIEQYSEKQLELAEKLKKEKGIQEVYSAPVYYARMYAVVGEYSVEVPMLKKEDISKMMKHFDAELIAGRLPENSQEILLDEKIMHNNFYHIGDELLGYGNTKIVGIAKSNYYFACGVGDYESFSDNELCILSDGSIEDFTTLLHNMGYQFDENNATIFDKKRGEHDLQVNVIDAISTSTNLIYGGIVGILSLLLLVVYITYSNFAHKL